MPDFAVSTIFLGKDAITKKLKAMGFAAGKFGQKTDKAFSRANRKGLTFKSTLGAILSAQTISRGVGLLTRGIRSVGEEFVTFDDAITQAGAKFPITAKRGSDAFNKLAMVARKVGAETKFSASEAAEGLNFLAMAGFNTEQAMAALPQVTNLAVVAGEDLARSTDIASDALGAFNLMTKDSVQLTANLSRVNDVFAKTVTSANTTMEFMFETMKDGAPVMTAAGASLETFATLTGQMANAGIKGTKAGTTLKNMFINLQAPVPKAQKLIKKLGIQLIDNKGKLRDIIDILGDFNKKTAKMGKAQQAAAINTIFGKRAIAGVNVLLAQGADKLREYRQTIIDSDGAAQAMATNIEKSLGNRLKALRSAAIELGFKFIDAFQNKIPGAIDSATAAVRAFDVSAIIDSFNRFRTNLSNVKTLIQDLKPIIELAVVGFLAYKAALIGVMAVKSIVHFMQLAAALKAATGAQSALNIAMTLNPIGVVVAAVAGLITAGVMLFRQWENIRQLWRFFIEEVKEGVRWIKKTGVGKFIFGDDEGKKIAANTAVMETAQNKRTAKVKAMLADQKRISDERRAQSRAGKGALAGFARVGEGRRGLETLAAGRARGVGIGKGGLEAPREAPREAPNKADVAQQNVNFKGKLTVAGAPEGSTIESTTVGAPPVQTELAGANI